MNNACHVCGSTPLRTLPFGYEFHGRRIQGIRCSHCDVTSLDPQTLREEIRARYSKEYFDGDYRCGHAGSCFTEATADAPYRKKASAIPEYYFYTRFWHLGRPA